MRVIATDTFWKEYAKIADEKTRRRIFACMKKLERIPFAGKPLRHGLKSYRSVRIPPFRLIYRIEEENILVCSFGHRDDVYL